MPGPPLSIALLGPPVIEVDGLALAVDTRKATALLAYLAVEGRPVRRDTLASLLWPENDPERARSALRRTLSTLRSALGARWLDARRDLVTLDGPGIWTDLAELRSLVASCERHGHGPGGSCRRCLEPLRTAAALARGPFLAGFGLRDSTEYDDWQQLTGEVLAREVAAVLDRLTDALLAAGDHAAAVTTAERRLGMDPLHEPAHRRLIGAYAASGDRSAALEQYRTCVRVLDRELGVRPLDDTTALYHAVLEGRFTAAPSVEPPPPPPEPERTSALVGRAWDLGALEDAYRAVGPDGRLALVLGEAGIGKSRLVRELLERVHGPAVTARCFEEEGDLAYGVASSLLRDLLAAGRPAPEPAWWVDEVARLLPELGPSPERPVDSTAAEVRFYEGVCEFIGRVPGAVLFVDDAHWADEASLRLLHFLARRLAGRPVLLALAWEPEAVRADHLLGRLTAERGAVVVRPARLTAAETVELVLAAGHDEGSAERVHRESGGLPFFAVEYVDALGRGGTEAAEWPVPGGVRELLERRLGTLGDLAAQILAAAAVLGRSFDLDTLRDASGRGEEEVVPAVEELIARGVLLEADLGVLEFRHEQERGIVYAEMTLARRRLLHRRVAAALGRREQDPALIAHHLALAGDEAEAAQLYRVAGDRARSLYANAEALGHYRAALALGHSEPATLHEAIGDLETLAGDYGSALASYEAAAALSGPELAPEVEHRIGSLHLRRGAWELAEAALAAALQGLDGAAAARATADRSLAAHRRGHEADASMFAADALALAEEAGDPAACAQAHNILGILAASRGDAGEAVAHLEQALALAESSGDDAAAAAALNNLALAVAGAGETERAIELTRAGLERAGAVGDRHREAALRNRHADLLHAAGRRDEAMAELKQAVALFAEVGEPGKLEPEIWKLSEW